MSEDVTNDYFNHLEETLKYVPASNLFNYDETNVTDDSGSKQVITHCGRNRVERKVHHSVISINNVCS